MKNKIRAHIRRRTETPSSLGRGSTNSKNQCPSSRIPRGGLILIIVAGIFAVSAMAEKRVAIAAGATVTHPIERFADGKARHFQFKTDGGITIRYFVVKSSEGVIRAAFDACDVCWPAGKGYYQKGDFMVCRNCGRRFASIRVNEVKGGCNPAPLKREVVGDKLVIQIKDILEGKRYFNFSEGSQR
jgi:uncharacterized membrane protein